MRWTAKYCSARCGRGLRLLAGRHLVFWTTTAWDDFAALRGCVASGAHRAAMP